VKQGNGEIAAAFRERLKNVAGFRFVPKPFTHEKQQQCRGVLFISGFSKKIFGGKNHQRYFQQI
jgi:hypothetical protein